MKQKYDGFWGRMLRIDLSRQRISSSEIAPALFRRYMGGRNLALHFLLTETAPAVIGIDPRELAGASSRGQLQPLDAKISEDTDLVLVTPIGGG